MAEDAQPGLREVVLVAAAAVAVILGAAVGNGFLPQARPRGIFHAPPPTIALPAGGMRVADTTTPSTLSQRETTLAALASEQFDVLIVGGGVVGCGALLDAAGRGLRGAPLGATGH